MGRALKNPLDRLFIRRCQIVGCTSVVLYLITMQASLRTETPSLRIVLAAVSGLAFFAELVSVGLLVSRKMDEFQRILLVRSFLWATVVTMGLATVWGFIDLCTHHTAGRLDIVWVPIALVTITAFAKLLVFRQYKAPTE